MSNKVYDILKYIAQIVLPAIATLYFALAGIWGFPYGEQIVGTITAIDTFIGCLLKFSADKYYKNKIVVSYSTVEEEETENGGEN